MTPVLSFYTLNTYLRRPYRTAFWFMVSPCNPNENPTDNLYLPNLDLRTLGISISLLATSTLNLLGNFTVVNNPRTDVLNTCLPTDRTTILSDISSISHDYGVSEDLMKFIVEHESQFNSCAVGDLQLSKPSLGLVQISMLYNPQIPPQAAFNTIFALEYLAEGIRSGKASRWSTYKLWLLDQS